MIGYPNLNTDPISTITKQYHTEKQVDCLPTIANSPLDETSILGSKVRKRLICLNKKVLPRAV